MAEKIEDFIPETQRFWSGRVRREIDPEEAREILANTTRYFTLLGKWAKETAKEPSPPPSARHQGVIPAPK